jgi:quercetin dioxygenase-like cupin family protein
VSYEVVHIDELESYPIANQQGLTWRPVRRRFDIQAFGVNAYTAERAGQRVVEEHRETDNHEELYAVVSGRATFTLDGNEHDAPAGTLVHCPPDTLRGAVAAEPGTTVLGVGAKPGEVFRPSGWEWTFAAFSLLASGDEQGARRELEAGVAARPDAWQGHYNYACLEARAGNPDASIERLRKAVELHPQAAELARKDEDFDSLRDDERFLAVAGQADTARTSA